MLPLLFIPLGTSRNSLEYYGARGADCRAGDFTIGSARGQASDGEGAGLRFSLDGKGVVHDSQLNYALD